MNGRSFITYHAGFFVQHHPASSLQDVETIIESIKELILNNPILYLPVKDDQAIDVFLAAWLLANDKDKWGFLGEWLAEIIGRAEFAFETHGPYPCILRSYNDLLSHPQKNDEYQKNATSGSILYPIIALWAAILNNENLFSSIAAFEEKHLHHCNFQIWYPDENTEGNLYTNNNAHGAILSGINVGCNMDEFLEAVFRECRSTNHFNEISANKLGWLPLIFVACRHHRIPLPIDLAEGFRLNQNTVFPSEKTGGKE